MTRRARTGAWAVAAVLLAPLAPRAAGTPGDEPVVHYEPARKTPDALGPYYAQLAPGQDAFPGAQDCGAGAEVHD